ncbi:MAG: hypothetical protein MK213_01125, partial [Planctomycetes bacterium]|nr:hypothetical protein [Planctomycetota bacterium]
ALLVGWATLGSTDSDAINNAVEEQRALLKRLDFFRQQALSTPSLESLMSEGEPILFLTASWWGSTPEELSEPLVTSASPETLLAAALLPQAFDEFVPAKMTLPEGDDFIALAVSCSPLAPWWTQAFDHRPQQTHR